MQGIEERHVRGNGGAGHAHAGGRVPVALGQTSALCRAEEGAKRRRAVRPHGAVQPPAIACFAADAQRSSSSIDEEKRFACLTTSLNITIAASCLPNRDRKLP